MPEGSGWGIEKVEDINKVFKKRKEWVLLWKKNQIIVGN